MIICKSLQSIYLRARFTEKLLIPCFPKCVFFTFKLVFLNLKMSAQVYLKFLLCVAGPKSYIIYNRVCIGCIITRVNLKPGNTNPIIMTLMSLLIMSTKGRWLVLYLCEHVLKHLRLPSFTRWLFLQWLGAFSLDSFSFSFLLGKWPPFKTITLFLLKRRKADAREWWVF